jgi:large subunit ribosomal protein L23Ae
MDTLQYPLATEKAIRAIEAENMITFIVDRRACKIAVKKEFQDKFKVKVAKIRMVIDTAGKKKAFICLKKEHNALDVATQLGLM